MKSINKKFAYLLFLLWKVCTAPVWMELPEKSFFSLTSSTKRKELSSIKTGFKFLDQKSFFFLVNR
jgi:hypothetical protein